MYLNIVMSLILLQAPGTTSASSGSQRSHDLDAKLHTRVGNYTLNADNFLEALAQVATRFEITMGIEWSKSPATLQKVRLFWDQADVQQVIETLVKNQPGYEFNIDNDVVHVYPQEAKSNSHDFVNLRIQKFQVRNVVIETASHQLRDLVRLTVSPPQMVSSEEGPKGIIHSQAASVGEPELTFKFDSVTVRVALDELAVTSDRKIWVVTFTSDYGITPTGFWRTRTLWNSNVIPDNEQPLWDMFHWGEAIPQAP